MGLGKERPYIRSRSGIANNMTRPFTGALQRRKAKRLPISCGNCQRGLAHRRPLEFVLELLAALYRKYVSAVLNRKNARAKNLLRLCLSLLKLWLQLAHNGQTARNEVDVVGHHVTAHVRDLKLLTRFHLEVQDLNNCPSTYL